MNTVLGLAFLATTVAQPAPGWLQDAETCNGWYHRWDDAALAQMRDALFVIGVPPDKKVIEKAHGQGTRVLVYVTFYQMPPGKTYQKANVSDHPDWNVIHPDGKEGISVFDSSDNPGWRTVCPNSPDYRRYALEYTKFIMDQGADGLFIDNGHPDVTCEAPEFGRHQHLYPGKDNIYAYRKLLEDVRAAVKGYGEDKIIIVNPGTPRKEWVGACDGQMLESYICTHAADHRWHKEARLLDFQRAWGPPADEGHAVVALSYIGHTGNSPREDAFYCYAWARISSFVWADWFTAKDVARALYKLRLGKPTGPMQRGDGYYMREFERGAVAVSSESRAATFGLSAKGHAGVYDVFAARRLKLGRSGNCEITLEPRQGRVYLFR